MVIVVLLEGCWDCMKAKDGVLSTSSLNTGVAQICYGWLKDTNFN